MVAEDIILVDLGNLCFRQAKVAALDVSESLFADGCLATASCFPYRAFDISAASSLSKNLDGHNVGKDVGRWRCAAYGDR